MARRKISLEGLFFLVGMTRARIAGGALLVLAGAGLLVLVLREADTVGRKDGMFHLTH